MPPKTFHILLNLIKDKIVKQHVVRTPISPRTRLEITLRYLVSGDSMTSLSYTFRVGLNTVSQIISTTCTEIWNCLKDFVLVVTTEEKWREIAQGFETKWNFPHCVGAIDGKHIIIEAPPKNGSKYYNYKNSHSIALLAVADSDLWLEKKDLTLPDSSPLVYSQFIFPYVFVGDEAFALSNYMMRPYPRSIIESAFGILSGRWRIFRRPINASVSTTIKITQATICLHNFIMRHELNMAISERRYSLADCLEDSGALIDIGRTGSTTFSRNASNIRDDFAEHFEGIGAVHWQWEKVLQNEF
ncbi:hypothetical protein NQ314_003295 [Rhamnusium bicolor]|uniref:DDE Tnp4 domain-containing protein n=1 Tax=Rhamnusium bicolor TaxID=1586634 RepID=A0AAV8ZP04_9CUCU|nr:hypothetical protein NQ314_003295 [Rhamnusium bicolor]